MENIEDTSTDAGGQPRGANSIIPEEAYVIADGAKVIPLTREVINIGRRLENHVVIDDPRVSRSHAQLRAIKGRYVIFDLNSTGGTFINGQRITQSVLYPGDVISLAGVTLVYGQKNPPPRPDLKETSPF
jgi:pSer/pThr/pTyr-binding forkhead associated (FHA) protein